MLKANEHTASVDAAIKFGAAYYPEHWPEKRWPEDARLMREAGMTVVRMGEFAWSTLQPSPGKFDLDWLARAIRLLAENGISTVLGTPTAVPPAWLVQKYPDLLPVDETGRRAQFGNRCHYCVNSPDFHRAAGRIVKTMAERFGAEDHVIGWQIDNEYNRVCYCDRCRSLFQNFLQEKFKTLEALNRHWSTRYWSETYSAWDQIPIPIGPHNPGLMLEFKHFVTQSYRKFQSMQAEILRAHLRPGVWLTHNYMGWFGGFDHYALSEDLNLAAWDWYVGTGHHDHLASGAGHDLTRGFKRRNFWLMETQPGHVNWAPLNNELDRGEARIMAWHAVAHGADGVLYWQWRSAPGGQEQYHGTLIDPSGRPRPFYEEAGQIGKELADLSDLLSGSTVKAEATILNCYASRWSIEWQRHHREFDYIDHLLHYYRALAARNLNVDIISADDAIDAYKLVIAPAMIILNEKRAAALAQFVARGGSLVLTLRTGMKDEFNALLPSRQPGCLAETAGVEVEDFYALQTPVPVAGDLFRGTCTIWAERLRILDPAAAIVLASYGEANGWLDRQPAVTVHTVGRGQAYYVGAYLDDRSQSVLMDRILAGAGIQTMPAPSGVEMRTRMKPGGDEICFVLNHNRRDQEIPVPWPARDHISGSRVTAHGVLPAYGVAGLTREAA